MILERIESCPMHALLLCPMAFPWGRQSRLRKGSEADRRLAPWKWMRIGGDASAPCNNGPRRREFVPRGS